MKKVYIKPVCELETFLNVSYIFASSGVSAEGDVEIGWGGYDDGTKDPDVKGEQDWDIWN